MRIGTDVSMEVCRNEGYMIMEFTKRDLVPKGVLQKDAVVRFLRHFPDYIRERMGGLVGQPLALDISMAAEDVWYLYEEHHKSIDNMCGYDSKREFPSNEYDLLHLASDVDMYCGLE